MHDGDLCLVANDKFYQKPMLEAYEAEKKSYLDGLPNYRLLTTSQEKLKRIIKSFSDVLEQQHLPIQRLETDRRTKQTTAIYYELGTYRQMLLDIESKWEKLENNAAKESRLMQNVGYFEDYIFLYTTKNPHFQLNDIEKRSLLLNIHTAAGVCSIGENGEFYTILQDHQKSLNWITDELTKVRTEVIRRMTNAFLSTGDLSLILLSLDLNVSLNNESMMIFDLFVDYANAHHLNIPKKETRKNGLNKPYMKQWFEDNYHYYFRDYEQNALEALVLHCSTELAIVSTVNTKDWNEGPVTLEASQLEVVSTSLKSKFGSDRANYIYELGQEQA
ncbi:MAG TPA: hypothetical protein VHD33_07605, partial [Legionellaceae bacterium]|nr:hypothetical protein [Legionellaceae bacterium]